MPAPSRIAIDMTPLAPGGQNGGSGVVATRLVREMRRLRPQWEFVLLTSSSSHAELASLDASNVHRACVLEEASTSSMRAFARKVISGVPAGLRVRAKDAAWKLRHRRRGEHSEHADLMLCPFTSSKFWQPGLPLLVIVHDLQHVAYPQFFSDEQRLNRDQHLRDAAAHAAAIVCVSDFVRDTLREYLSIEDERMVTIRHGLLHNTNSSPKMTTKAGDYLLYPANFWPHKNHRLLFDALVEYRRQRPDGVYRLVCTGASGAAMASLRAQGPDGVQFAGYVSDDDYMTLLDGCAALVYPSLYEGFGMPVLEAMARGKPVLCSRIPPLQEVAGDAARYFDPTSCDDVARAMLALEDDAEGTAKRVEYGRARAQQFGDATSTARSYVDLIENVLGRQ